MPELDPEERRSSFHEVTLGYTEELVCLEAQRCLQGKRPACMEGCPVEINIPAFIAKIREGDYLGAAGVLRERNSLPAISCRVCPQESQCEAKCLLNKKGEACAIGRMARFVTDYERSTGQVQIPEIKPASGKKAAIIGSGPAGLTAAGELAKNGVAVTVFEALHALGGVLVYGIPEIQAPQGNRRGGNRLSSSARRRVQDQLRDRKDRDRGRSVWRRNTTACSSEPEPAHRYS